jgi:hypothetical protein
VAFSIVFRGILTWQHFTRWNSSLVETSSIEIGTGEFIKKKKNLGCNSSLVETSSIEFATSEIILNKKNKK